MLEYGDSRDRQVAIFSQYFWLDIVISQLFFTDRSIYDGIRHRPAIRESKILAESCVRQARKVEHLIGR
jgi:hypothetical protein